MNFRPRSFLVGLILAITVGIAVADLRGRARANRIRNRVTVEFGGYTNQNSSRRMLFRISNSGPAGIEFDLGEFEWADLARPAHRFSAFGGGYSGSVSPGKSQEWLWMSPTRGGVFRYRVPCRREQTLRERCHNWFYRRFGRPVPKPKEHRQVWIVTSPWTKKTNELPNQTLQATAARPCD